MTGMVRIDRLGSDSPALNKLGGNPEGARNALAKSIVDMAKNGERDSQRLIQGALTRLRP
jgi:hypothetical protein